MEKVVQEKTENDTEVWLKYFLSDYELKINAIEPDDNYRHSSLKTSIDYPEDYEFMKRIFILENIWCLILMEIQYRHMKFI